MFRSFLATLVLLATAALPAPAQTVHQGPQLLLDVSTGTILAGRDIDRLWVPASLTKLMTAYVTMAAVRSGALHLDDAVIVSRKALRAPPSKMGFPVGTIMTVDNALKMVAIKSANDIAIALAETVAGSSEKFVQRMNLTARQLGMINSRFVDPNGLSSNGQQTTARDMALLALALHRDFPKTWEIYAHHGIRFGKKRLRSYNALLGRFAGADGLKTGFVCASGYNIVASATREGRRLVAVILGANDVFERAEAAAGLLAGGFAGPVNLQAQPLTAAAAPASGAAANLRSQVCREGGGAKPQPSISKILTDNAAKKNTATRYALAPLQRPLKWLRVSLGGARGYTGTSINSRIIIPPVPRRRPERALSALATSQAPASEPLALAPTPVLFGFITGIPTPNPGRKFLR